MQGLSVPELPVKCHVECGSNRTLSLYFWDAEIPEIFKDLIH